MISGRYYTSEELQKLLGVSGQRISDLSRQHDWDSLTAGVLYHAADVDEYLCARQRTELSKKLGWAGRGLIWDDNRDMDCPECGGYAVEAPATPEEMQSARWLRAEWDWLCVQGHKGKSLPTEEGDTAPTAPDLGGLEQEFFATKAANPDWDQSLWDFLVKAGISPDDIWGYSPSIGWDAGQEEPDWL